MSKRLGGIMDCKDKTSSWHFIEFPDDSCLKNNLNVYRPSEHPPVRGNMSRIKCHNLGGIILCRLQRQNLVVTFKRVPRW